MTQRSVQQRNLRSWSPVAKAHAVEVHPDEPDMRARPFSLQALPTHSYWPVIAMPRSVRMTQLAMNSAHEQSRAPRDPQ